MTSTDILAPHLADGTYVLAAALEAGLHVELFPRQIMTCWEPNAPEQRRSFVHGIPDSSTLSAVTYAQDKRVTRALLERAALPTTTAATFSFRGRRAARRYATRIGYPVHVRLAMVDSVTTTVHTARNRRALTAAISDLRRLRDDSTAAATNLRRSAYSLTGLLEPEIDEDGSRLWARSTRFVVERQPKGARALHALVVDGDPLAAFEVPHFRETTRRPVAVADLTGDELDLISRASRAIAGLGVARVELVTSLRRRGSESRRHRVRDVGERPGLADFDELRPGWGPELAMRLVGPVLERDAVRTDGHERSLSLSGVSEVERLARLLENDMVDLVTDPVEGTLAGSWRGDISSLGNLLSRLLGPGVEGIRAMQASSHPEQVQAA
jgi:hypothetical protein